MSTNHKFETNQQLTVEAQASARVTHLQLRIPVGIEHIDDIKSDLEQAFAKSFSYATA